MKEPPPFAKSSELVLRATAPNVEAQMRECMTACELGRTWVLPDLNSDPQERNIDPGPSEVAVSGPTQAVVCPPPVVP
jgi:hypothetical protein